MRSPSIDLSYLCPQKYATIYIYHIHYVLLLFLEVQPTYTHYNLSCFYPRNTHWCCSYPRSTHSFIHSPIHISHPLRKCSTPTLGGNTQKNIHCHYVYSYLSNKALVILVDTPFYYQCIKRVGWSLKNEKRKKEDKSLNAKERQPSPYSQVREVCYP